MRRYVAFLSHGLLGMLAACNTVEGAGQDVATTGQLITESADEVQEEF